MKREEEILKAAAAEIPSSGDMEEPERRAFLAGAEWADEHPKYYWISVKDGLPEIGQSVLIYLQQEHCCAHAVKCAGTDEWHVWGTNTNIIGNVTYWMPIPPIPDKQ